MYMFFTFLQVEADSEGYLGRGLLYDFATFTQMVKLLGYKCICSILSDSRELSKVL